MPENSPSPAHASGSFPATFITDAQWETANERRGNLIDKELVQGLTEEESAELADLQTLADHYISQEGIYADLGPTKLIAELKARGLWHDEEKNNQILPPEGTATMPGSIR